jgi:hypothetical protein
LVAVNLSQKKDFEFETEGGLRLWTNKDFGYDGKVTQPVLAKVICVGDNVSDLSPDDIIVCHHNTFRREVNNGYMHGDTGEKTPDNESIFAIEPYLIQCRVDPDSGDPVPLAGFALVERIPLVYDTKHIIAVDTEEYIPNQFRVIEAGGGKGETADIVLAPGDIVITYEKSDYDIEYTYKLKPHSAVRVKYVDILAISKKVYP